MTSRIISCVDLNNEKHNFSVNKYSFRPSVYGILINENQEVLMVKHRNKFCFPGGGMEIGERIHEALSREVFEETGLRITNKEIVECDDSFFLIPYEDKPVHSILMFYRCAFKRGVIKNDNIDKFEKDYAEKAEWVSVESVLKMNNLVFPQTKRILKNTIKKR